MRGVRDGGDRMDTEEVTVERRAEGECKEEGTERGLEQGRWIGNCFEHARSQ